MTDDASPSHAVDAAAALGGDALGETPRPTDRLSLGLPPPADGDAVPPSSAPVDSKGVPFDARTMEVGMDGRGIFKTDGSWKMARGNKARAAKGLPPILPPKRSKMAPGPAVEVDLGGGGAAEALDEGGDIGGAAREGVLDPPAGARMPDDYDTTAAAIVGGLFGGMQIAAGEKWQPATSEERAHKEAWKRTLASFQAPLLPAAIELVVLVIQSIAKRRDDPETRTFWAKLKASLFGLVGRKPREQQPRDDRGQPIQHTNEHGQLSPVYRG